MGRILCLLAALTVTSSHASTPGDLRSYATIRSIGVEWDVSGDTDTDAQVAVRYRLQGDASWRDAMPLVRTRANGDMLAGSVMFLQPGSAYELELSFTDSDGSAEVQTLVQDTRPVPTKPTGGQIYHVTPGASGGDGSELAHFGSIDEAEVVAQPGDTFLLHAGDYGVDATFDGGGDVNSYVVWQGAGDGEALFYGLRVNTDHLWIEDVVVLDQEFAMVTDNNPVNVVVSRCQFRNNDNAIVINDSGASGWTIMDNTIVGTNVVADGSFSGEGVLLGETDDHVVMYNSISLVADGLSYPGRNVDIYGNDIFDTSDDGLEIDNGLANVRLWGNRLHNSLHNAISFQPQTGAPWYILRNQVIGFQQSAFKFREGVDKNIVVHNTFIAWDWVVTSSGEEYMKSYSRNNLFISIDGGKLFDFQNGTVGANTDLDYDGFDWAGYNFPFKYDGNQHVDLASFTAATGLEQNGTVIDAVACMPTLNVPGQAPVSVPPQHTELASGCAAIDAGVALPNLSEAFLDGAPDLGAYEFGAPLPHYGPRNDEDDFEDTGVFTTDTPTTPTQTSTSSTALTGGSEDGSSKGCACSNGGGTMAWFLGPLALIFVRRGRRV